MGLDTKTYWLTDRQSQCNFDLTWSISREWRDSSEQRRRRTEEVQNCQKWSEPEDKSLVNVLYICEVNNCGYNCEYSNK
jgi:hypothetical protein